MDFLECKICNVPYDENDHRPRQVPCGHGLCSACLRALIKDRTFECPKCRQKNKVDAPENLPVNYDLIEVIRAFKAKGFSLTRETEIKLPVSTNDEICNIHCESISHWCHKCQIWICISCLEDHPMALGCSTAELTNAIKTIKGEHVGSIDTLITKFEDDTKQVSFKIQEHTDKRKEHLKMAETHSEEEKKLHNMLEKGNIHKEKLVESRKHLTEANSPNAIGDCIKIVTQRKQILRSWSIRTLGVETQIDLKKALKENKIVYVDSVIKDEKNYCKLSMHKGNIYFHKWMTQKPSYKCIFISYNQLQISTTPGPLVFLEITIGGVARGKVIFQLDKNLPNIRENMLKIATGITGKSLAGIKCDAVDDQSIRNRDLPFSDIPVTPDSNRRTKASKGDVVGCYPYGYLQQIIFSVDTFDWGSGMYVIGSIVDGIDIIQDCYDNYIPGLLINDCGIVLGQD